MSCLDTTLDKIACLGVGSQVDRFMDAGILQIQVNAKLHETLKHFYLRIGRGLMNTIVPMDVLVKRVHPHFHE